MTRTISRIFVTGVLMLTACGGAEHQLPVLFAVPDAALVSDSGSPLRLSELRGNVAIYNFIFTQCDGICPILTRQMQSVVGSFEEGQPIRFVSVSVDPANDTPEALAEYAMKVRNDDRWIFLTGSREDVIGLSVEGFKLAAGDPGAGAETILHSSKFALVDGEGQIRGYYDSTSGESMKQLIEHAKALIRETT